MNATLVELFYNLGDICDKQEDWSKSKEIVMTFLNNIDVLEENCYKKARRISGIAYSLNNDYENMEMIKQAEDMLYKALGLMDSKEKVLPEEKMDYINAKGNILSNFGSNSLAKRKYYEEKCMEPLKQALNYHKEALEFRENQYEHLSMAPEKDRKNVRLGIATSYTTIATDCFYLKDYKKAIENHLKAIKIREELGNEVGKNINQQRIIGCVLNLYRENFAIDKKYLSLVLEYYPQLLISNQEYNKRVSLQENIERFIYIMRIINNDRRYKGLIETAKEKCKAILEWLNQDEELKKSMKDYVQELEKYVNQYIEENI